MDGSRSEVKRLGSLSIWDGLDRSRELPPSRGLLTGALTSQGISDRWQQIGWAETSGIFFFPVSGGFAPAIQSGQSKSSREVVQPPLVSGGSRQELACASFHPSLFS